MISDLSSHASTLSLEVNRRFKESFTLAMEARAYFNIPANDPLRVFADEDFMKLNAIYHF